MIDNSAAHMTGFRRGDTAAFMRTFEEHHRPLLYFARTIVTNTEAAEELVSDCFIKLWQLREQFETATNIKSFLYISVKNACLNYIKTPYARQQFQPELAEDLLSEQPQFYAKMIQAEVLDLIYREIENLPEKQRAVFRMSHLEGYSTEEICAALDMTPNAVFANRSRATETLKKVLKDKHLGLYILFLQLMAK
jgi:RNA polymerase sigma-70 factor (family 1)